MRINRMKLCNFSSYSGTHEFDFTVSSQRNIVLIGGQNGTGKTSLFTAIKLALYGPLCFHFQSKNNQYTAKIKGLISRDAFAQPEVHAYVEIEIELPRGPQNICYTIRREWNYEDKRLTENDYVWEGAKLLELQELDFFQNYLYHVIPPNLFDFFFFDGEEIAGFFSAPNYQTYLKEAVLTLEHYDTFSLVEKYSRRYTVDQDKLDQAKKWQDEYDMICDQQDRADQVRQAREQIIIELENRLHQIQQERLDTSDNFNKRGGLSKSKINKLKKQMAMLERRRDQINLNLKNFVEEAAPLVMTAPVAVQLRKQLSLERQMQHYETVRQQLSAEKLERSLADILPEYGVARQKEFVQAIAGTLERSVRPEIDTDSFHFLHDLSQEQQDAVGEVLSRVERFDRQDIADQVREKADIYQQVAIFRKTLDSALSKEELEAYEATMERLEEADEAVKQELAEERQRQEEYEKQLEDLEKRRKSLRSQLIGGTGRLNAGWYADRMSKMLQDMLSSLLERKRREIEAETLRLSKEILRKEHFIDLIELDEKFDISLYRQQTYTFEELSSLFANVGLEELSHRIGLKGITLLRQQLHVDSIQTLKKSFRRSGEQSTMFDGKKFELYNRIEFQQLSKGEKQIFILSLYWAIIKLSGRDIPFIIDTPYARIDTEHREQIAEKFFPSVSGQVIILSTDEEITPPYYNTLRPHIAQEYTLTYNEHIGQTAVARGYSFGGDIS